MKTFLKNSILKRIFTPIIFALIFVLVIFFQNFCSVSNAFGIDDISEAQGQTSSQTNFTIPDYPGGTVKSSDDISDGYTQITIAGTSLDNFNDYKTILENEGYYLHAQNDISDNIFATYLKENGMIHYYFTPYSSETRIIYSQNTLVPSAEAPSYTKINDESLSLVKVPLGLDDALGCIYRLEDGSFVVIDGGRTDDIYGLNTMTTEFMNLITSLAPNPNNIIIRAWYISHPHRDHYGVLQEISDEIATGRQVHPEYYNLHVESFIYNFVSTQKACEYLSGLSDKIKAIEILIHEAYPNAKYYKALTGQVYKFPGVELEILNSMCDVVPNVIGKFDTECELDEAEASAGRADGNLMTLVSRIKSINTGKVFMITADSSKKNNQELVERYGDNLKADYMTVNHHGHDEDRYRARNGNVDLYNCIDPDVILFPATIERYNMEIVPTRDVWYINGPNQYVSYSATSYIYEKCKNNCYVAGVDSYSIPIKADPKLVDDLTISFIDGGGSSQGGHDDNMQAVSAATNDSTLVVICILVLLCGAGAYLLSKKKYKNCLAIMICTLFVAGVAYADVGFSKNIVGQVTDSNGVVFSKTKLLNTNCNDVEISSSSLSSTSIPSDVSWKFSAGDTVIFDGHAGTTFNTNLRIPAGGSVDVELTSDISSDSARSLIGTSGLNLSFNYDTMAWVAMYNVDGTKAHDDIYVIPGEKINFPTNVTPPKGSSGWNFEGWYDAVGNKVEGVSGPTSVFAHYYDADVKVEEDYSCDIYSSHNRQKAAQQGFVISDATQNEGSKIFQAEDGGYINVYNFEQTGETVQEPEATFTLGSKQKDNHCNNLEWGAETPEGCSYPAMYVSVGKPGADIDLKCFVEGITKNDDGSYSSKTVQTISIETSHRDHWRMAGYVPIFGAPSWLVDREQGYIWVFSAYQRTTPAVTTANWQNEYIATKFKLPKLADGKKITLFADDILDQVIFPYETCFTQAGAVKDGKIYYCFGVGDDSTRPSRIRVFDTNTKTIFAGYNLEKEIPIEPEDVFIKDGYIYMDTNTKVDSGIAPRIYRISMPKD